MRIRLRDGLPLVGVVLQYRSQRVAFDNVLLDTGSASSVFSADSLLALGVIYEPEDSVHRIRGVGGSEFVFSKQLDRLSLDALALDDCPIEVGAMEYGVEFDGILGMDFLASVGAVIDLGQMEIRGRQ